VFPPPPPASCCGGGGGGGGGSARLLWSRRHAAGLCGRSVRFHPPVSTVLHLPSLPGDSHSFLVSSSPLSTRVSGKEFRRRRTKKSRPSISFPPLSPVPLCCSAQALPPPLPPPPPQPLLVIPCDAADSSLPHPLQAWWPLQLLRALPHPHPRGPSRPPCSRLFLRLRYLASCRHPFPLFRLRRVHSSDLRPPRASPQTKGTCS
jgi:hypothetical protein